MSEVELAQDLVKTKQEVVDVKNRLIDSQDRLQASLLDHKKTLEELVEVSAILSWCNDNVGFVQKATTKEWACAWHSNRFTVQPTLYQALHSAWVARDTTKDL